MTIRRRVTSTFFLCALTVAGSLLLGAPAASQDGLNDALPQAETQVDTLDLAPLSTSELEALRNGAIRRDDLDPWRNGSSQVETWTVATAENLAVQRQEGLRLELEAAASMGRVQVGGQALAASVNREEQIQRRLTALVVDSFVNGEVDALDKLAGSKRKIYVEEPVEVSTEVLTAAKLRMAAVHAELRTGVSDRTSASEEAVTRQRLQSYALEEAEDLDRASRREALNHVAELRDRRAQVLKVSGEVPDTVLVNGFRVSPEIADNLAAMLAAAAAAAAGPGAESEGEGTDVPTDVEGPEADAEPAEPEFAGPVILAGWGYRSTEEQINLRINHCGETGYAIFDGPSPACFPPTARPLHSLHEQGLALDFTENGLILDSSSAGFRWLQQNAAAYGFFNLPSEPWHWSTTGN